MKPDQRTSRHASLETPPRARRVYLVRYQLPERTSQTSVYLSEVGARRRVKKLTESGAKCVVHTTEVGDWSAVWPR